MRVRPDDWPALVEGEVKTGTIKLKPQIGALTITAVTFECSPSGGITFASESYSGDSSTTVSAKMTAVRHGEYVVIATCTLSDSSTVKPRVRQRVLKEEDMG